ncbi:MAG TPA: aminotransferase class V-fold PLP-dependent enzyme [Bacilli bacterium]|nr:aminotransferase class V-fold PLP-dependent enzyme [Bacilli bacterium]
MNRDDFPMLKKNLIYFDNGATTLKPKVVVDAIKDYYESYTANVHRGDYDNSIRVDEVYESVRDKVKLLINANSSDEIIFTKGSTDSLNMIVFGFMRYELHKDDEVILTKTEHASNVLPWMELSKEIGFKIKYDLLNKVTPMQYGGGMNENFSSNNSVAYAALPSRLEAGTPNISGVIGLGQAISYLLNIRQDNIYKYEHNLRTHLVEQLNTISGVTIYNEKSDSGIVIFNIGDIGAGDVSTYLNKYNICVRSGNHCTKMLKEELQVDSTCRISLYFYNTKKEIDFLIKKLKSINYDDFKYN